MTTKQTLIDAILLKTISKPEDKLKYFQRGLLKRNHDPFGDDTFTWDIDKFRWYKEAHLQQILEDLDEKKGG